MKELTFFLPLSSVWGMNNKPHEIYVGAQRFATYRHFLTSQALRVLDEIACDEEYPGSCDPNSLSLLATLIHTCQVSKVLQIGTWIGFSSVVLASAIAKVDPAKKAKLWTLDIAPAQTKKAAQYVDRASLARFVNFVIGDSTDPATAARLAPEGPFDIVFIDSRHDYSVNRKELDLYYPLTKPNGFMALHDCSKYAATIDTEGQGGVLRALSEWMLENRITNRLVLDNPVWPDPMGFFILVKPPN